MIELVAGFAISPIRAALGVSILPLAALAGAAIPVETRAKALAGRSCSRAGRGLAFLPAPTIAWTVVPQILAGAGMGLALPALSPRARRARGGAQPRRPPRRHRARARDPRAGRHARGSTTATDTAILQGAALMLDAQIDPLAKLELAPGLLADVNTDRPRASLSDAVDARRADFRTTPPSTTGSRTGSTTCSWAVHDAFRIAYLIAAALALVRRGAAGAAAWRRTRSLSCRRGRRGRLPWFVSGVEQETRGAAAARARRTHATHAKHPRRSGDRIAGAIQTAGAPGARRGGLAG